MEHTKIKKWKLFFINRYDEINSYDLKTWFFWRGVILYFFLFSLIGHWLEIPYCHFMNATFGIVEADYAAFIDQWYVPYWVYGFGTVAITVFLTPLKIKLIKHCKSFFNALLLFFVIAIIICAVLETSIGLIINQPDQFGQYPYWNNEVLPLNILNQGWLVNDIMLGFISTIYVWFIFPELQKLLSFSKTIADTIFGYACTGISAICVLTYVPMIA